MKFDPMNIKFDLVFNYENFKGFLLYDKSNKYKLMQKDQPL